MSEQESKKDRERERERGEREREREGKYCPSLLLFFEGPQVGEKRVEIDLGFPKHLYSCNLRLDRSSSCPGQERDPCKIVTYKCR